MFEDTLTRRWLGFMQVIVLLVPMMFVSIADAIRIRVSQESRAGASDFHQHILGHIVPLMTETEVDEAYAYNERSRFSFNGTRPVLRANTFPIYSSWKRAKD